jgi:DNA polymerase III subunit delta
LPFPVRATPESFQASLAEGPLPRVCLITGVEPLLIDEAATALRAQARATGYGEREVHFIERGFDWDALLMDANSLSLFANLRLIELKLRTAPDAGAARQLMQLAARPPADTVLLVTGELEPRSQKAAWVNEFERCGTVVVAPPMTREQLPRWIARRLRQHGITLAADAAQMLADRVEGNLLAAQQEIERIALLRPKDELDGAAVAELVADNARFDVFELAGAAFAGNAPRALRILDGLRGEGREPPLILWALLNDLRAVSRVLQRGPNERNLDGIFRAENVWGTRQGPIRIALQRMRRSEIDALLVSAARADRVAKGSLRGDPWVELTGLVARIAGVQLVAA